MNRLRLKGEENPICYLLGIDNQYEIKNNQRRNFRQTFFLITGSTWVGLSQFAIYVALPLVNENIDGGTR